MNALPDLIDLCFVDREPEMQIHRSMITSSLPRIFCIEAKEGWGKTWLLERLFRDHQQPGWLRASLDLSQHLCDDAEKTLRQIMLQMGGPFREELQKAQVPGSGIHIDARGSVQTGDLIAGNQYNVTVNSYGSGQPLTVDVLDPHGYELRVQALTEAFKAGLQQLGETGWALLYLDNFIPDDSKTSLWLKEQLFPGIRSGQFCRLIVVIASTGELNCFQASEWKIIVKERPLGGLPLDAVRTYWLKRCLPEKQLETILDIAKGAKGSPAVIASLAEYALLARDNEE